MSHYLQNPCQIFTPAIPLPATPAAAVSATQNSACTTLWVPFHPPPVCKLWPRARILMMRKIVGRPPFTRSPAPSPATADLLLQPHPSVPLGHTLSQHQRPCASDTATHRVCALLRPALELTTGPAPRNALDWEDAQLEAAATCDNEDAPCSTSCGRSDSRHQHSIDQEHQDINDSNNDNRSSRPVAELQSPQAVPASPSRLPLRPPTTPTTPCTGGGKQPDSDSPVSGLVTNARRVMAGTEAAAAPEDYGAIPFRLHIPSSPAGRATLPSGFQRCPSLPLLAQFQDVEVDCSLSTAFHTDMPTPHVTAPETGRSMGSAPAFPPMCFSVGCAPTVQQPTAAWPGPAKAHQHGRDRSALPHTRSGVGTTATINLATGNSSHTTLHHSSPAAPAAAAAAAAARPPCQQLPDVSRHGEMVTWCKETILSRLEGLGGGLSARSLVAHLGCGRAPARAQISAALMQLMDEYQVMYQGHGSSAAAVSVDLDSDSTRFVCY
ncbi:MAG: hypothetical protein WDW36_007899 [Sanguina aurantia]